MVKKKNTTKDYHSSTKKLNTEEWAQSIFKRCKYQDYHYNKNINFHKQTPPPQKNLKEDKIKENT